jgi:phosphoribosylglycinamide formyltransferase 2
VVEVIVEAFVNFHSEITLLTVTQNNNPTLFCAPIGHRQERGDYQESWQPSKISDKDLFEAQDMAEKVTEALGGAGLFGVEFFLTDEGVYFSELSPCRTIPAWSRLPARRTSMNLNCTCAPS